MGLTWFEAPRFYQPKNETDPDPANWTQELESPGSGGLPYSATGNPRVVLCYNATSGTCLVGFAYPTDAPNDWTAKTLEEAVLIYEKYFSSLVPSITGATIAVVDSTAPRFQTGQSVRIWSQEGLTSEALTITDMNFGTGPNGEDEIIVNVLNNTYSPGSEIVTLGRTPPPNEVY